MVSDKRLENAKERVEKNDNILEEHKKTILEFDRRLRLDDYSNSRRYKYLTRLPKMAQVLDVPFEEAEKRDIEDIKLWLDDRKDIKDITRGDYLVLLKAFYRWIGDGEHPDCVDWIDTTNKVDSDKVHQDLLTEDDIITLLENCKNKRDKAFISLLWETGARISEILDLNIGDIEDRANGYKVKLVGKTGQRRIPLVTSIPQLRTWIEEHPRREEKDAPLFINIGPVNTGQRLKYKSANKILKKVMERSDLQKPANPHHYRHSRATALASKMTESQLKVFFGWSKKSDVPSDYVHLSGRDLDAPYDKMHGKEVEEEPEKSKLLPDRCPRCEKEIGPETKYCPRCGQLLKQTGVGDNWKEVEPNLTEELKEDLMKESIIENLDKKGVKEEIIEDLKDELKHEDILPELLKELED